MRAVGRIGWRKVISRPALHSFVAGHLRKHLLRGRGFDQAGWREAPPEAAGAADDLPGSLFIAESTNDGRRHHRGTTRKLWSVARPSQGQTGAGTAENRRPQSLLQ